MKRLKSFEFFSKGMKYLSSTVDEVNEEIKQLSQRGINPELIITPTGTGIVYNLIWEERV